MEKLKETITEADFAHGERVAAPEALGILYKEMKKVWKAVEIEFARPAKLTLANPKTSAFAGSILFESALYVSFPKTDRLVTLGRYYSTQKPVCSIMSFPVAADEERDATRAMEKILYCGKDYAQSIVLYANREEVFSNSHHHGDRLEKGFVFSRAEQGILASCDGGFLYANPELSESFSRPMLRALEAVFNKC